MLTLICFLPSLFPFSFSTSLPFCSVAACVVVSRLSFKTLYSALAAAGLADTLRGAGPFTLFAPTNEAFAELPPDQLQALLADPAALGKILTYHVVAGAHYVQP